MGPKSGPTPRHTDRLTVGRKFNFTPLHSIIATTMKTSYLSETKFKQQWNSPNCLTRIFRSNTKESSVAWLHGVSQTSRRLVHRCLSSIREASGSNPEPDIHVYGARVTEAVETLVHKPKVRLFETRGGNWMYQFT
jgi:hypothetical protein